MKTIKSNKKVLMLVPIVLGLFALGGCVKKEAKQGQESIREEQRKEEVKEIDTSNWQTYRNEEFGFEVKYPEEWKYEFKQNNYGKVLIVRPTTCADTYGYYESDCGNLVIILITDSSNDELKSISGWGWAVSENSERVDRYVDGVMRVQLNVDSDFKARLTNEFDKSHHRYFFERKGLKYLFTIKYFKPTHNPKIEKAILEAFQFTEN